MLNVIMLSPNIGDKINLKITKADILVISYTKAIKIYKGLRPSVQFDPNNHKIKLTMITLSKPHCV